MKQYITTLAAILLATFQLQAEGLQGIKYFEPKLNVASLAVGVLNPAVEVGFSSHSAVELSIVSTFARKNFAGTGKPMLINQSIIEYRYYTKKDRHTGFFAGGDLGWDVFKGHKSSMPLVNHDGDGRSYDWGTGFTAGATLGYKYLFNNHLSLEASISGGWRLSHHEPYTDGVLTVPMNRSAEWLAYKGGIYLSYRFK